jgi:phosphotransacetylase
VAFLSFSTAGRPSTRTSSVSARPRRCAAPRRRAGVDGELQFDAAFVPAVARKNAPDSPLEGRA